MQIVLVNRKIVHIWMKLLFHTITLYIERKDSPICNLISELFSGLLTKYIMQFIGMKTYTHRCNLYIANRMVRK